MAEGSAVVRVGRRALKHRKDRLLDPKSPNSKMLTSRIHRRRTLKHKAGGVDRILNFRIPRNPTLTFQVPIYTWDHESVQVIEKLAARAGRGTAQALACSGVEHWS